MKNVNCIYNKNHSECRHKDADKFLNIFFKLEPRCIEVIKNKNDMCDMKIKHTRPVIIEV